MLNRWGVGKMGMRRCDRAAGVELHICRRFDRRRAQRAAVVRLLDALRRRNADVADEQYRREREYRNCRLQTREKNEMADSAVVSDPRFPRSRTLGKLEIGVVFVAVAMKCLAGVRNDDNRQK